jgi:hypothetical protein
MQIRSLALVALVAPVLLARGAAASEVSATAPPPAPPPVLGVMVDAGVPDGINASLVVRPFPFLRLHAGGGRNFIGSGVRAGLTLAPFGAGPTLTVEGGHYFDGDANGLARKLAGDAWQDKDAFKRFGYSYANGHLGLDFGRRWVTFYLHGGLSYIRMRLHDVDSLIGNNRQGEGGERVVAFKQDVSVRAIAPSVKAGLVVYFW